MRLRKDSGFRHKPRCARPGGKPWALHWGRALTCLAAMAALAGAAQSGQQPPSPNPGKPDLVPSASNRPNADSQARDAQATQRNDDAATAERKKQLAEDSAKLFKLATELTAEVDKTTKDTLSLNVIRKADEIERLARSVKGKVKLTAGGS